MDKAKANNITKITKGEREMRLLNFGSLNLDYIYSVDHFVQAGETLDSIGMEVFCGGKGLNQSIAIRKSGQEVWHAGAIGEGDAGILVESLLKEGVHINLIMEKKGSSGHAIIQKDSKGQNCILLYGGANEQISKVDIDTVLHQFDRGDYVILQNEISEVGYIMEKAHEKGMHIVFNPSPLNAKVSRYPLEYVDYLILNEIEAQQLCLMKGILTKADLYKDGLGSKEELKKKAGEELAMAIADSLPNIKIILTLGVDGAIYKDDIQMIFQRAYEVDTVDTTGAGDTFTGFFVGALAEGKNVQEAMALAAKASALSVTRKGASPSIPTLQEVITSSFQ